VDEFGDLFDSVHTRGVTDGDDFVACPSDRHITAAIRSRFIRDASLGIVLLGSSTWSQRFVDWEIAAAIGGHGETVLPLVLFDLYPQARSRTPLPPRLTASQVLLCKRVDEPQSPQALVAAIDQVRTQLSENPPFGVLSDDPLLRCDLA
jgi:hypothetical protein